MAEFQLILLTKEDLELADRIINNVDGVSTIDGAVKWALRQYALQPGEHIVLGQSMEIAHYVEPGLLNEIDFHLPLDRHHTFSVADLAKETVQWDHTVVVAADTFERLVPDKTARTKLLGHEIL
jgi:hypothetical protein